MATSSKDGKANGSSPIGAGTTRPRSQEDDQGPRRPRREVHAEQVPVSPGFDDDNTKKVEDDIERLTKDMAELTMTRQKILARGQEGELPQGGDLRRQVDEWKAIMDKEREEYEARRQEQDGKLERLIKLAEQQQQNRQDEIKSDEMNGTI